MARTKDSYTRLNLLRRTARCYRCKTWKEWKEFHTVKKTGLPQSMCKECAKSRQTFKVLRKVA